MSDLTIFGKTYSNVKGIKATDTDGNEVVYGGGYSIDDIAQNIAPRGEVTILASFVGYDAFKHKPITRVHAPNATTVHDGAFVYSGLTRIDSDDFPLVTKCIGGFQNCASLAYVKMTSAITNFSYAFRDSTNLEEAYFPNSVSDVDRVCYGCTKLTVMDCGSGRISHTSAFYNCYALRTLVLRKKDGVQTLASWSKNCLGGIYSHPTESEIYVPSALIESYQTASNWKSAYEAGVTFKPIEGSIYE